MSLGGGGLKASPKSGKRRESRPNIINTDQFRYTHLGVLAISLIGGRPATTTTGSALFEASICCNNSFGRKGSIFGLALKILMKRGDLPQNE